MLSCAQKQFTLEDIIPGGANYRTFSPERRYLEWWGDNPVELEVEDCYVVDKNTGNKKELFSLDDINGIVGAKEISDSLHSLLHISFPYGDKTQVRIRNSKNIYLIDWEAKNIVWKQTASWSQSDELSYLSICNWKALNTAYVSNDQIYVATKNGDVKQVTTDGSREIVYGQSVHRNEFGIDRGLFWNDNGTKLAFYRMDQSMVADYPQVDIDARVAEYKPDKYPMAGETSHKVTIGVYDVKQNKTIYLNTGDVTDRYFTNIAWDPDGKNIYLFELNRKQNDCRLVCYNSESGEKVAELYRETSNKYVEPQHPVMFLPWDKEKFILQSQKDGFNHLYLFDTKGKQLKQITKGEWLVMSVEGFNVKDQSVIITSNEFSPIQSNLVSVNIKSGKRTAIDNKRGYHYGKLSGNGEWILDTYSEPDVPRVYAISKTDGSYSKNYFTADDPWQGYYHPIFESGNIKSADNNTTLYYSMVKPADFNPNKKYPVIVYVYGGPHAHMVDASWHYRTSNWWTYMSQLGYIVFCLDNRGSENRGLAFEQATFHQLGQVEMQDQMQGVKFLKNLPYVDTARIGVHGWSYGGYMTISLMTNYPDVFKVGVAGGPVIDWKWYEVMYGERYMGTPQDNPEGYEKVSLINKAGNLKGKLQIISGYNDPVVVPQHCLSFIKACISNGTQPDFFVYPGQGHNMVGSQRVHLHQRITDYFEKYLK